MFGRHELVQRNKATGQETVIKKSTSPACTRMRYRLAVAHGDPDNFYFVRKM